MEYTGTCRTKMTIDGVPMDISEDRVESFLSHYGRVQEVSAVVSKSGIASGDFVFQVTLTHQSFGKTPNILLCKGRRMLVVAEVRKPYFWHGGGLATHGKSMTWAECNAAVNKNNKTSARGQAQLRCRGDERQPAHPPLGSMKRLKQRGRRRRNCTSRETLQSQ